MSRRKYPFGTAFKNIRIQVTVEQYSRFIALCDEGKWSYPEALANLMEWYNKLQSTTNPCDNTPRHPKM